jgi:hypothetical protein
VACHWHYDIYGKINDEVDDDESNDMDNDMYDKIFHINYST